MAEEIVRIMCPSLACRKILAVPASSRGKTVRCRNCGATIRVPVKETAPAPGAAPAPEEAAKAAAGKKNAAA